MKNFSRISFVAVLIIFAAGVTLAASDPPRGATPAHTLGPSDAPVTLEMFSDFQCPQCARSDPTVRKLKSEFGDKLRIVFRHFPMEKHQNAILAACAAEAAARQNRFWEMADALYRTQWMWENAPAPRVVLIERAKELLMLANMPLADVASHSGFGDQAAFTRTFHRVVGAAPGQWRREHGGRPER